MSEHTVVESINKMEALSAAVILHPYETEGGHTSAHGNLHS